MRLVHSQRVYTYGNNQPSGNYALLIRHIRRQSRLTCRQSSRVRDVMPAPHSPRKEGAELSRYCLQELRERAGVGSLRIPVHYPMNDLRHPERVDQGQEGAEVVGELFGLVVEGLNLGLGWWGSSTTNTWHYTELGRPGSVSSSMNTTHSLVAALDTTVVPVLVLISVFVLFFIFRLIRGR